MTAAIVCAAALFLIAAFYIGLTVRFHTVQSEKFSSEKSPGGRVRIVQISDLHNCSYGRRQRRIINKINSLLPDLIVYTGDIADDHHLYKGLPDTNVVDLLDGLKGLCPAYYVTGNHEFRRGGVEAVAALFQTRGVVVLNDGCDIVRIAGQRLCVCGISSMEPFHAVNFGKQLKKAAAKADFHLFTILLAHQPEHIDAYRRYPFDLVLSGHAHGGQWRIPFLLNGVYAPGQGLFPKYAGGLYRHDVMTHVVSRGLATHRRVPRIFNPPEITVIDIVPQHAEL